MAEQLICNQQVDGSTPFTSSKSQRYLRAFPSGQRGQTVNLLSTTSVVRIHPLAPPKKAPKTGAFFGGLGCCFGPLFVSSCDTNVVRSFSLSGSLLASVHVRKSLIVDENPQKPLAPYLLFELKDTYKGAFFGGLGCLFGPLFVSLCDTNVVRSFARRRVSGVPQNEV